MARVGAVLTGGASRRMGRTKALIRVDGVPMAEHVAEALRAVGCDPVVACGGDPAELAALPVALVPDAHPGEGPVGAVIGILEHFEQRAGPGPSVFVVACDLPGLSVGVLRSMIDAGQSSPHAHVVVAQTSALEPTCALWNLGAITPIRRMFADGERALHTVIEQLDAVRVTVDAAALRNINTPDDLRRYC